MPEGGRGQKQNHVLQFIQFTILTALYIRVKLIPATAILYIVLFTTSLAGLDAGLCHTFSTQFENLSSGCNPSSDGRQYTGHKSVTETGKHCQAWASQSPHSHSYTQDDMYPDGSVTAASNYCRNPDRNWNEGVWCYTTDRETNWEKCDVPACGQSLHFIE